MQISEARRIQIVQIVGIAATIAYGTFVLWIYVTQPRTISEIKQAAAVQTNVYEVAPERFALGLKAFREGQYRIAVDHFTRADPAARDPKTLFLIAYSHYALGRGRLYDDDAQFRAALAAVDRCLEVAPNNSYTIDAPDLELDFRSAERLRQRLLEGLEVTPGDLNPFSGTDQEASP